jgi:hypothetical protein
VWPGDVKCGWINPLPSGRSMGQPVGPGFIPNADHRWHKEIDRFPEEDNGAVRGGGAVKAVTPRAAVVVTSQVMATNCAASSFGDEPRC